jgi:erythromycin esterase-like protein
VLSYYRRDGSLSKGLFDQPLPDGRGFDINIQYSNREKLIRLCGKMNNISKKFIDLLEEAVFSGDFACPKAYEHIAALIGDARLVLMGEATHGTAEFYQIRMQLSQYLIQHKGFQAIAIEGDWTSAYPIYAYLQGKGEVENPMQALNAFKRFPSWMWRNHLVPNFLRSLRQYNDQMNSPEKKVGFYGLDLYCLNESAQAVIAYLQAHHPEAAKNAIERYACFDHMHADSQMYSYLVEHRLKESCLKEVTEQLLELQHLIYHDIKVNLPERDEQFYAMQNARVVKNAEAYYRALFESHHVTWNIRDQHMADTLQNIIAHLETISKKPTKVIVWAHNSHIGDARATEMSERQEINLGQLVRERFNTSSFLLGFSTAIGKVTAASHWDGPYAEKKVQAPIQGSYEYLFHQLKEKNFLLDLRDENQLMRLLASPQLQRAIGVIYRPETERMSHYFFSKLPHQFDALIHMDETHALIPLDKKDKLFQKELPETYPEGF